LVDLLGKRAISPEGSSGIPTLAISPILAAFCMRNREMGER